MVSTVGTGFGLGKSLEGILESDDFDEGGFDEGGFEDGVFDEGVFDDGGFDDSDDFEDDFEDDVEDDDDDVDKETDIAVTDEECSLGFKCLRFLKQKET